MKQLDRDIKKGLKHEKKKKQKKKSAEQKA